MATLRLDLRHLLLILAMGALMTACTDLKSALLINACSEPATVLLSERSEPPTVDAQWDTSVRVPPLSTVNVRDAFFDIPEGKYLAQFSFEGEQSEPRTYSHTSQDPEPVIIPAELCPGT